MGSYYSGIINSRFGRELYHHGIKGQKWGVRNYQNIDGTLTNAGRDHYGIGEAENINSTNTDDPESGSAESKIKALYSQLKDKDTSKELDFYLYKLKNGTMSAEQALQAAQEAVALDKERAEYKKKKREKEAKSKNKKTSKSASSKSSNSSSSSSSSNSSSSLKTTDRQKVYSNETLNANAQFVSQRENGILQRIQSLLNNSAQTNVNDAELLNAIRNTLNVPNTNNSTILNNTTNAINANTVNGLERQRLQNKNYVDYVKARQRLLRSIR